MASTSADERTFSSVAQVPKSTLGKQNVVQVYGRCDDESKHDRHVFLEFEFAEHNSWRDCPGVYVDCLNCDDRKCMDCVLRYWHEGCEESCPMCCERPVSDPQRRNGE